MKLLIALIFLFAGVYAGKGRLKHLSGRFRGYSGTFGFDKALIYNLKLIEFRDGNSHMLFQQKSKSHKYLLEINPMTNIVGISSRKKQRRDDLDEYLDINYVYSINFEASKIIQCKIFSDSPHVHIKFGVKPAEEFYYRTEKNNYLSIAFDLSKKSQKTLISRRLFESCKGELNNEDFFSNPGLQRDAKLFLADKEPPKIFTNYPDVVFSNKK